MYMYLTTYLPAKINNGLFSKVCVTRIAPCYLYKQHLALPAVGIYLNKIRKFSRLSHTRVRTEV